MSWFDGLGDAAFSTVQKVMGDDATWNGITAKVLFNDPTGKEEILQQEYDVPKPSIEYRKGTFTGLFELVEQNKRETVEVNGMQFNTMKAERKYDGKTIIIYLSLKP